MDFIKQVDAIIKDKKVSDKVSAIKSCIDSKYKESSRPTKATTAKKYIKETYPDIDVTDLCYRDISRSLTHQRVQELRNQTPMEIDVSLLNILKSYKNDQDKSVKLGIFLLLASGIRIGELFDNEFTESGRSLFIKRVSKRRDNMTDFKINLIFTTPKEFIQLYEKFKSLNTLNKNSYNRAVNRHLNQYNLSAHDLRSIYLYYIIEVKQLMKNRPTHLKVRDILNQRTTDAGKHYDNKIKIIGLSNTELYLKTNVELRLILKNAGVRGISNLKKAELIEKIRNM